MAEVLTHAQVVALASVLPSTTVTAAKKALADGSHADVHFAVEVFGRVQKGAGTPDHEVEVRPKVDLVTLGVFADTLRRLGVSPETLERVLRESAEHIDQPLDEHDDNVALAEVIESVEAEEAARRPSYKQQVKGRAGRVDTSGVHFSIVPTAKVAPCPPRAA